MLFINAKSHSDVLGFMLREGQIYFCPQTLQRHSEIIRTPKLTLMPWNALIWKVNSHPVGLENFILSWNKNVHWIIWFCPKLDKTSLHPCTRHLSILCCILYHVARFHSFSLQVICRNFSFSQCMLHSHPSDSPVWTILPCWEHKLWWWLYSILQHLMFCLRCGSSS
jgi:hypothetical protein